jgi:hypothetical protein
MKERYVLAICAASGFVLTAGISLWRSREPAAMLLVTHTPARVAAGVEPPRFAPALVQAAVPPPSPPPATLPQPNARPQGDYRPDEFDSRLEQQARRLARRAAEREGH